MMSRSAKPDTRNAIAAKMQAAICAPLLEYLLVGKSQTSIIRKPM